MRISIAVFGATTLLSAVVLSAAARVGVNCRRLSPQVLIGTKVCDCEPCHLCELAPTKASCQLIVASDTDASDGSQLTPQQPPLDPVDWFLTKDELTSARNAVPRSELSVFTRGNKVSTFVASNEFFSAAEEDIKATKANDTIYWAAWTVDEIPFDPVHDPSGAKTGTKALVGGAMARGVDFRAIVWDNFYDDAQMEKLRDYFDAQPTPPKVAEPGHFLFDNRLSSPTSSHHQKTLIVRQQSQLIAYVGGVDPSSERWDTIHHNESSLRKQANIYRKFDGWLDAHLRIQGPAALDVGTNFLERWNSKTKPTNGKNPAYPTLPEFDANGQLTFESTGGASVQIARTFSCKYNDYDFAPHGEHSILAARVKAIRQAKNYVYVEDQYFFHVPELLEALLSVLPRLQRLIVVMQSVPDDPKFPGFEKYVYDMIAPLQKRFPNKFQLYTTKASRNLYVHSKVVLVDDVFLSLGSANWNRRGMTSDSEIIASVVDSELVTSPEGLRVAKLARDFRVRKFMEHTGRGYAELASLPFLEAANALDAAVGDPKSILDVFEVREDASFASVTDELHLLSDPNDVCEVETSC